MTLTQACSNILNQLEELVRQIHEQDFSQPVETLSGSTIGQHLRHTLEFFFCLEQGYEPGLINYDKRPHDKIVESDKYVALSAIGRIKHFILNVSEGKPLDLEVGYDVEREEYITIKTNFTRELVYNIEHAVHHMALIKIGVNETAPYINLPQDFGIAASTIRYKESVDPAR